MLGFISKALSYTPTSDFGEKQQLLPPRASTKYSSSLVSCLPHEIWKRIFSYLSMATIARTMRLSKGDNREMATRYLLINPHKAEKVLRQWLLAKNLSRTWQNGLQMIALQEKALILDSCLISRKNRDVLPQIFTIFSTATHFSLAHPTLSAAELRRCPFPKNVTQLSLYFDDEYLLPMWQRIIDIDGYFKDRMVRSTAPHILYLPCATLPLKHFSWHYNGLLPACDYRDMAALETLQLRAQSLQASPLAAPPTLQTLYIHLSQQKCSSLQLSSLQLEKLQALQQLTFHCLPLHLANISALIALHTKFPTLRSFISFKIYLNREDQDVEVSHGCNQLAECMAHNVSECTLYISQDYKKEYSARQLFFTHINQPFCRRVTRLYLESDPTDDIVHFASKLPLQMLSIRVCRGGIALLKAVSSKTLEHLCILENPLINYIEDADINDGIYEALSMHPQLKTLTLSAINVIIQKLIESLPNLKSMRLLNGEIFPNGSDILKNWKGLHYFSVLTNTQDQKYISKVQELHFDGFVCCYQIIQNALFEKRWRRTENCGGEVKSE